MKKLVLLVVAVAVVAISCGGSSKNKVEISSAADLVGKKISVQLGTTSDLYVSELKDVKVERYAKTFEAVNALKQGKVDAAVLDGEPAKVFVAQNPDLMILPDPVSVEDYAMCVSKKNPELKRQLDAAVEVLQQNGTIDALYEYYINKTEGSKPYQPKDIQYKGVLRIATNAEFPPYEYNDNGKIVGFDIDLARAIADLLGKELVVVDMHFDSVIPAVQSGKADLGVSGITINEERKKNVDFSEPYYHASIVIVIRK
jgi:polar amino acid transport system substrate-binding protein